jgi:hypothetical protein
LNNDEQVVVSHWSRRPSAVRPARRVSFSSKELGIVYVDEEASEKD